MKKHKFKIIYIFLITLLFFSFSFANVVTAIPTNYIILDNFNDYNYDVTSGTGTYIAWERTSGNHFNIQGTPLVNYYVRLAYPTFDTGFVNSTTNQTGYYILTDGHSSDSYHSSNHRTFFSWKNNITNETLVQFERYDHSNAGTNNKIYYYPDGTRTTLCSITQREEYYIAWNFYNSNIIQYLVYDENWNLIQETYNIGYNSSVSGRTNYNISCLYINNQFGAIYPSYSGWSIFDNYGYIDINLTTSDAYPELLGAIVKTYLNNQWISGIPNICLGSTVAFNITAVGEEGCRMCISICNDTETIYYACSLEDTLQFYMTWNIIENWTITIVDPIYYPDGYESNTNFSIIDCGIPDYEETYGNFYAEFYTDGSACHYIDNDIPIIIYHFNDSVNFTTVDDLYMLDIYQFYALSETCLYSNLFADGSQSVNFPIDNINLYHMYNYEIRVYNVTKGSSGYERNVLIYTSNTMSPCADIDNDGIPDPYDEDITDIEPDDEPTEEEENLYLLGLAICLGIGTGLVILTHVPATFFGGMIITAYIISHDNMGSYQMLPTEVGIGLIVILVLMGFLLWITD